MNELTKVFNYSGNEVRTVLKDGEVWFVAKDVCEILDLDISSTRRLKTGKQKGLHTIQTLGGVQSMVIINEAGVYKLVFTSRKEEAEQFTDWIAEEVLPSIRKHGTYMTDNVLEQSIKDPNYMIGILTALRDEKKQRLEAEKTVNILTHVNKTYTATEIAKELGFKSATALNKDLATKRIQYKQNNTWVLFSKYAEKGYVNIKQEVLDNGRVIYHRRFTQMGRGWLLKLYGIEEGA